MERDLNKMASTHYDMIVIGGGISGACVAWDAALRGLKVALLEKKDFGHATSAAPSKMIHGGLRYLKNLEFGIVRDSLRERRIMELIAPHQVYPFASLMPTYGWGMQGPIVLSAAMKLYDTLGFDKKRLDDEERQIPSFQLMGKTKTLEMEPTLDPNGLTGGVVCYDCQMHSPERLTLEFILSAAEFGADVINYVEVTGFQIENQKVKGVTVKDSIDGNKVSITGEVIINVSGPWADILLGLMEGKTEKTMIRSKGIHVITPKLAKKHSLFFQTAEGKHIFMLPWRNHSLIGTTDTRYQGEPDKFKVTETDIQGLIDDFNGAYAAAKLKREDIVYFYGGLRPIVETTDVEIDVYKASRKYEILDHEQESGLKGLITVIGGKFTTSRHLAEKIVNLSYHKLRKALIPCQTHTTPLYGGQTGKYSSFVTRAKKQYSETDSKIIDNLCRNYGSRMHDVMRFSGSKSKRLAPKSEIHYDISAQVIYSIQREMAQSLDDFMFRRSGLGTLGTPGDSVIESVAKLMAKELQWDEARKSKEIEQALDRYVPSSD